MACRRLLTPVGPAGQVPVRARVRWHWTARPGARPCPAALASDGAAGAKCLAGHSRPRAALHALPALDTAGVANLLQVIRVRVLAFLRRRSVIEAGDELTLCDDAHAAREPALAPLAAAAGSGLPLVFVRARCAVGAAAKSRPGACARARGSVAGVLASGAGAAARPADAGVTAPQRSATEAAQAIAGVLDAGGFPYAIGGALALGVAGFPRGTLDVDVNVFVEAARVPDLVRALAELVIAIDAAAAVARADSDGMFSGVWDGMRIDVFVPSIPFSDEAARTRVRVVAEDGWTGWFLAPEAIVVFKLLFFRGKDIVDLERLVAVRGATLDHAYVRSWLVDMMGDDDERVKRWDGIVRKFADSPP